MSSSSPPHPQNEFENPLTDLNCLTVIAETPPNIEPYGNLHYDKNVKNVNILFILRKTYLNPIVSTATDICLG